MKLTPAVRALDPRAGEAYSLIQTLQCPIYESERCRPLGRMHLQVLQHTSSSAVYRQSFYDLSCVKHCKNSDGRNLGAALRAWFKANAIAAGHGVPAWRDRLMRARTR